MKAWVAFGKHVYIILPEIRIVLRIGFRLNLRSSAGVESNHSR